MAIKLLAFDLDGTIIKEDRKTVSTWSIEGIDYAAQRGIIMVIATGRMVSAIPNFLLRNKNIQYLITANGAKLQDARELEVLYESRLDYDKVKELSDLADKLGIFYELYCGGKSYAPRQNKERILEYNIRKEFFDILNERAIPFENLNDLKEEGKCVEKFNMLNIPRDRYSEVWDEFSKIEGINQVSSIKVNIEINSDKTSKWNALKALCKRLNIKEEEVMTIGDSGNDYEMIKKAGFGVAMDNSFDEVKDVADCVTDSIEEEGFYKIIKSVFEK